VRGAVAAAAEEAWRRWLGFWRGSEVLGTVV
jgi:hypothetical protein